MTPGKRLGHGGSSVVLEASDHNLLRETAMKVIRPDLSRKRESVRRLIEEAQITAQLDHPHIVPVYEIGEDSDGRIYFTMKQVNGQVWSSELEDADERRGTAAELNRHLHIFLKVCDAVSFAHSRGVVHRDIKPDNVLLGSFGEVYLTDWGVARVLPPRNVELPPDDPVLVRSADDRGLIIGTPAYMAPEQARAEIEEIDECTDVFGLGAVLYEILTGLPPYAEGTREQRMVRAMRCQFPPPETLATWFLPPALCGIASKALSADKASRYQSVAALKQAVDGFVHGARNFNQQYFSPGEIIVHEGDRGDEAFFILRGSCQVFKTVDGGRVDLRRLGSGEVFGETAVFTSHVRSASVQALDAVTTVVVRQEDFEREIGLGDWLGVFVKTLANRFREADRRVTTLERERDLLRLEADTERIASEPD